MVDFAVFVFMKHVFVQSVKDYGVFCFLSFLALPGIVIAFIQRDRFMLKVVGMAFLGAIPLFSRWLKHGIFIGKTVADSYAIPPYLPSIEHFISGLALPAFVTAILCASLYISTYALRIFGFFMGIGIKIVEDSISKLLGPVGLARISRAKAGIQQFKNCDCRPKSLGKCLPRLANCGALLYCLYCLRWEIVQQGYWGYHRNRHFVAPHGYVQWEQLIPELFGILISLIFMRKAAIDLWKTVSPNSTP